MPLRDLHEIAAADTVLLRLVSIASQLDPQGPFGASSSRHQSPITCALHYTAGIAIGLRLRAGPANAAALACVGNLTTKARAVCYVAIQSLRGAKAAFCHPAVLVPRITDFVCGLVACVRMPYVILCQVLKAGDFWPLRPLFLISKRLANPHSSQSCYRHRVKAKSLFSLGRNGRGA